MQKNKFIKIIDALNVIVDVLQDYVNESSDKSLDVEENPKAKKEKKTEKTEEQPKVITLEEVRTVLAIKSKDGFTEQIKEIINSFGADKLSEVDPAKLGELLKEAEKLG